MVDDDVVSSPRLPGGLPGHPEEPDGAQCGAGDAAGAGLQETGEDDWGQVKTTGDR